MRFRTWPVAAAVLTGLLLLVVLSVKTASQRAEAIFTRLDQVSAHHQAVENKLRKLRGDIHLSGIYVRDYLLDTARERAPEYRERLAEFRDTNRVTLAELRELARSRGEDETPIIALEARLEEYWEGFEPLFDWTVVEKIVQSASFLRREVLPRREAVLTMAQEIEELNNANLEAQRAEGTRQTNIFRDALYKLLWQSVFLGLLLAIPAVVRLRILERRAEEQKALAQEREQQMRLLSQQLVATQEEERRKLSRELHDHVGQMLTALRMELGRIERVRAPGDTRLAGAVTESKQLVDNMVHTVRDLALGLRPSMLDDLGLQPALEWQARDFTRRSKVPVELDISGNIDALGDAHRTCVYRVVQEALTNCVRHAHAAHIRVVVRSNLDALTVTVSDDGVGLDPGRRASGFGLRGIEERVRELGGTVAISSESGQGATLSIRLPLITEDALARAAG